MADIMWSRYGIGKRFEHADLSAVSKKYFGDVFDYAENAGKYLAEGRGLLIAGQPGIGKTYAITALMKHLKTKYPKFDFQFMTSPGIFDTGGVLERRDEQDKIRQQSWWLTLERVKALVVNDIGKEDRSRPWLAESVTAKLGRILRARHEEQLPIFLTTNLPVVAPKNAKLVPTFETTYGEAIWSLLYDMTVFRIQVQAPDLRKGERDDE